MANTFLRSGNLDTVLALGENGQPVWLSALQIRETLRLRQQQALADLLAIPQANEAGNRLDWYAPFGGKIVPWNSASETARAQALSQIERCETALRDISEKALSASKPGHKLFGALLAKALQFPDQHYVYLVGGKPVITFWGFNSLNKKQDALEMLRSSVLDTPPASPARVSLPPVAPVAASVVPPAAAETAPALPPESAKTAPDAEKVATPAVSEEEPVVYERPVMKKFPPLNIAPPEEPEVSEPVQAPAVAVNTAAPVEPHAAARSWRRYAWVAPSAALVAVLGFQLHGCMSSTPPAATVAPAATVSTAEKPQQKAPEVTPAPVAPAAAPAAQPAPVSPPVVAATPAPSEHNLPVAAAVVQPAAETPPEAKPAPATSEPAAPLAVEKDDLVLPENAVRLGSTKFLNGTWRAILDIKTPITGKPPSLRYQMNNGKGVARLTQGDGSTCRVDVYAGVMKSGNLVINTRTKAKCSDGARFAIPEVTCTQGASGPSQCTARYDENTAYPLTFKREGK